MFWFCYVSKGNAPKLVHTPLTDKCYLTLTQGMHMGLGGNPYGPAGTGKTESVKALGGLFGRQVLVFNCDEVRLSSDEVWRMFIVVHSSQKIVFDGNARSKVLRERKREANLALTSFRSNRKGMLAARFVSTSGWNGKTRVDICMRCVKSCRVITGAESNEKTPQTLSRAKLNKVWDTWRFKVSESVMHESGHPCLACERFKTWMTLHRWLQRTACNRLRQQHCCFCHFQGIDVKSMGRIFVGLVKCGAWGCFDEFNRLEEAVLSTVSMDIQVIQAALKGKAPTVELLGRTVSDFRSVAFRQILTLVVATLRSVSQTHDPFAWVLNMLLCMRRWTSTPTLASSSQWIQRVRGTGVDKSSPTTWSSYSGRWPCRSRTMSKSPRLVERRKNFASQKRPRIGVPAVLRMRCCLRCYVWDAAGLNSGLLSQGNFITF